MRVPLLDLHDLGHRQTGNETWARGIARALFQLEGPQAYDIAVTAAVPAEDLRSLPARQVVRVGESSVVRLAWQLPRALRQGRNTAVLVQYTVPATRVPAAVMVHDLSFEDPRASEWLPHTTRLRYRTTIRASVKRAAHVLTASEFSRRDLMDQYRVPGEMVSVAPPDVDERFAALLDAEPERRVGRLTVLAVGNVLPRKNLVVLARAVRILQDRGIEVSLRIVGTVQPTGRRDAEKIRGLLADAVTFTGYLDQASLAREYKAAHVLAFPSLFEGFGIPVLEARRAGLPVVVSDRAALPEVAGDGSSVVPAEEPEAWAEALVAALHRPVPPSAQSPSGWASSAMVVARTLRRAV